MMGPETESVICASHERLLNAEIEFFEEHCVEWLPEHQGQFVLIGKQTFCGFYKSHQEALLAGVRAFGLVASFLIREVAGNSSISKAAAASYRR